MEHFPWLKKGDFRLPASQPDPPVLYLNSAGKTALPVVVEEAGINAVSAQATPWEPFGDALTEEVRDLYATLINSESAECIALAPSTAFAISLAAKNIAAMGRLGPGKKVLLLDKEMASNVYPWQHICKETGASLCIIPFPSGNESWLDKILLELDESVAAISLGATHWCDGCIVDIHALSIELHRRFPDRASRPFFIIDGTQSIGAMHFDVTELRPDFVCCSVHKWLLGGRGLSLVYVNPVHHNTWQPLDHHDRTREGSQYSFWDNIGTMRGAQTDEAKTSSHGWVGYPEGFLRGARRLDAGGGHNYVLMSMLKASLTLLTTEWTPDRIYPYLTFLTDTMANVLEKEFVSGPISVLCKEQRRGNILGVRIDPLAPWHITPERIVDELKRRYNILAVVRQGVIRLSPYIYHTETDMLRAAKSLIEVVRSLNPLPRVLITGGSGWLAQHLYKNLSPDMSGKAMATICDVHVTCRESTDRPHWVPASRCHVMDLSGGDGRVDAIIQKVSPQYIIHCAAVSAIATCETDEAASAANSPSALVDAICKHAPEATVVFTSTDIVFAGRDTPYTALSPTDVEFERNPPVCEYGKSKLRFEQMLAASIRNYVVLRLSNTMGSVAPFRPTGMKFLEFLETAAKNRKPIDLKNDEFRSFVDIGDIIKVIQAIIDAPNKGNVTGGRVYNMGGPAALSRVDLAISVAQAKAIPLQVFNAEEKVVYSTVDQYSSAIVAWDIHSVSLSEFVHRNPPTGNLIPVPLNVSMDSSATEEAFEIKLNCMKNMLSTLFRDDSRFFN